MDQLLVERWNRFEIAMEGPKEGNPFKDALIKAIFTKEDRSIPVQGFYDGNGLYKVRFMPDEIGEWSFRIESNYESIKPIEGTFECIPANVENRGPVRVVDETHFAYADGTPFYPFGTTAYAWIHQSKSLQEETLTTLAEAPFNKVRMCLFPKYYDYNLQDPDLFPYKGQPAEKSNGIHFDFSEWANPTGGFDFTQFNPVFFEQLERQIEALQKLNIEVDLILFHPYDRWGFASMGSENDLHYLSYVIARLASFRNIWWSMANEYDLMELAGQKKKEEFDGLAQYVCDQDPSGHLLSIHNWHNPPIHHTDSSHWYDHRKEWITHASIQHDNMFFVPKWIEEYKKPIVIDECRYEGNLNHAWGNISAEKMVQQFWEGICRGSYVTHGETYLTQDRMIWWSHGGKLTGESVKRIAFLRAILEEGKPKRLSPLGPESSHWESAAGISGDEYALVYFGNSQPSYKILETLPESVSYRAELIDTWNMTITPLEEPITNKTIIPLPSKPYIALLLTKE